LEATSKLAAGEALLQFLKGGGKPLPTPLMGAPEVDWFSGKEVSNY
jgi:hypothetical protein